VVTVCPEKEIFTDLSSNIYKDFVPYGTCIVMSRIEEEILRERQNLAVDTLVQSL
jgi:hypothetical protein